jgi:hypothetical protein
MKTADGLFAKKRSRTLEARGDLMSILAHITVVQCDRCEHLETLTNDVERESFDKLWLRTHSKDFASCVARR